MSNPFELELPGIFNFRACLDYMARSAFECLYTVDAEGVNRLLRVGDRSRLIRLSCPREGVMQIEALDEESFTPEEQSVLSRYVREWFDLDRDLEPFYAMSRRDPLLGGVAERFYGLRLVGIPDLFEAICWAIAGQQVNLTFAYKLKQRLTNTYGEAMEWKDRVYRRFPEPGRLADVTVEELSGLQFTRTKAGAILATAERMASGELGRDKLLALSDFDAMEEELRKIKGIGPWTAHYVRMRCLRDQTAFPVGDVGLQNAVKGLMGLPQKPTVPELQKLFEKWTGWEAYATFYLWRTLY